MNRRHFTLIELAVVAAIVAIIAVMLVPALREIRSGSRELRCLARKGQFVSAQTLYRNDYGYMVAMTPLGDGKSYWAFSQLLTTGTRPFNLGYLPPEALLCVSNPYSDTLKNIYDGPVGMPHLSKTGTEVEQFIRNGSGDCFVSEENAPAGLLIPEKCKAPSAFFIVADATFAAPSNKVVNKGGSFGIYCAAKTPAKAVHLAHADRTTLGFVDGHAKVCSAEELRDTVNKPKICIEIDGLTIRNLE